MAATAISGLTALTAPAVADQLIVVDDSASDNRSLALSYVVRDTGGTGAIVTGAYTLTLPATGTAALLGTANVFTKYQTINYTDGSQIGLTINTPASPTGDVLRLDKNGTAMIRFDLDLAPRIQLSAYDNGTGTGASVAIYNNTNATTSAAGNLQLYTKSGIRWFLWVDDNGVLRIGQTSPTSANDTSGTVVGTQS